MDRSGTHVVVVVVEGDLDDRVGLALSDSLWGHVVLHGDEGVLHDLSSPAEANFVLRAVSFRFP